MNISRFVLATLFGCILPAFAQPISGFPYPILTPDEAARATKSLKPISLHLKDVTLRDAFVELGKQSGIELDLQQSNPKTLDTKVSLNLETTYFLEAFQAILKAADIKASLENRDDSVSYVSFDTSDLSDLPLSGQAAFQVHASDLNLSASRSVSLGKTLQRSQNDSLDVNLLTLTDPRIPVLGSPRIRIARADDDKGLSLQAKDKERLMDNFNSRSSNRLLLRLKAPSPGSQKIAHLEGLLVYVLPTKYESWQIDDVLKAQNPSHEFPARGQTVKVTIKNIQQTERGVQLKLELSYPDVNYLSEPFPSPFSVTDLPKNIILKDSKGQKLRASGLSGGVENGQYVLDVSFPLPRTIETLAEPNGIVPMHVPKLTLPLSFTLNVPTEFVQTEVPFSFSNLPLP